MNNQPAFPTNELRDSFKKLVAEPNQGMELRDYFAAKTVTWFLTELMAEDMLDDPALTRQFAAEHAYKMADAMLKAREV